MLSAALEPSRFVRPRLFAQITGYTVDAVTTKVKRGVWLEGHEFVKAPDGNILIDLKGYEKWAANQRLGA
jgi:hypothetical protein